MPAAAHAWLTLEVLVVSEDPSPNCHQYAAMLPFASDEPAPLIVNGTLAVPVRSGPALATGSALVAALAGIDVSAAASAAASTSLPPGRLITSMRLLGCALFDALMAGSGDRGGRRGPRTCHDSSPLLHHPTHG